MTKGNFILFRGDPKNPLDVAIMDFTNGPFSHTELDMGDGTWLGEHGNGLTRHPAETGPRIQRVVLAGDFSKALDFGNAAWAEAVANNRTHQYSWEDIVMDAAKFVGLHIVLKQPVGEWDCSDFVTRALLAAGLAGPLGDLAKDPSTVSPNDLGRAFKQK